MSHKKSELNIRSNGGVEVSREIRSLLMNAIRQKGWYFFDNPQLCKCWEEMDCSNDNCPSYKSDNLRCWQTAGTFCEGEPQGEFAKKIGDCLKCRVYQKATEGHVFLEVAEDFNNLMYQLKTNEDYLKASIKDSEEKNRELEELNTKISRLLRNLDNKNMELQELSVKDGLTGLYNYRYFKKSLQEKFKLAKRYGFSLSCMMVDIDFFKAINDTYGHQHGDEILKQIADILVKNVRDTDEVIRYGGEEFALLFPHTELRDVYNKAESLRNLISRKSYMINKQKIHVTVSIGVASYPANKYVKKAAGLVDCSDKALYQAKEGGRNRTVIFDCKSFEDSEYKIERDKSLIERRQYPRIQTLINVKGELNSRKLSFSNAFDISCSGLSLVSGEKVEESRILNIKLFLPGIDGNEDSVTEADLEGVVVWCKGIEGVLDSKGRKKRKKNFLLGIQFTGISRADSICLQKYFSSIFQIKKKCLT